MRPQPREIVRSRLAVGERREQRRNASALHAGLDPRDALDEAAPTLAQAAVDLRICPPCRLADLLVREPVGAQHERADLLRLELVHRLGADAQPLAPFGEIGRPGVAAGVRLDVGRLARDAVALRLAADGEGLVLDDGLEPGKQLGGVGRRRLRQQDLDAALVGVLGVLRRGGVATRRRHQLGAMPVEQLDRGRVDLVARRADPVPAVSCSSRCRHDPRCILR